MSIYNIMFTGGLIFAILFFILTVVLFFLYNIPQALGSVTGQTEKKALEAIRSGKNGGVSSRRRRKSQGRIVARDIKTSTSTGSLISGDTDVQKSGSGKVTKDTGRMKKGTGSIKKGSGNIKMTSGGLRQGSGNIKQESGGLMQGSGNIKQESGDLMQNFGNIKNTDNEAREAKEAAAAAAAEMAAKEEAAREQAVAEEKGDKKDNKTVIRINPKTGKRYELDEEDTEVLTYGDMQKESEAPTTFLGAKMPGDDEATDLLRDDISESDLYDDDLLSDEETSSAILEAGMAMDFDKEDTDLLTATAAVLEGEEVYDDAADNISEADTDLLLPDGTTAPKPVEEGERKRPPKSITDMLRKAMEEGKNIPDVELDEDDYDDEDEEYTYSASEEITSVLKAEAAAQEALTQEDVNGILDENLTSVLRAGMMPGAEEEMPMDDNRIEVIYAKTIVHTEETL